MNKSVHGLDALNLMKETGGAFSREYMNKALDTRFGADARYHVCVKEGMTAEELIDFLIGQKLLTDTVNGLVVQPDTPCNC